MADEHDALLTRLTKVTFLARMGVILVGVAVTSVENRYEVVLVVLLTAVAALGLFETEAVTRVIARHPIVIVADTLLAGLIAAAAGADSLLALYAVTTAILIGIYLPRWFAAMLAVVLVATFVLASLVTAARPSLDVVDWTTPVSIAVIVLLAATTRRLQADTIASWRATMMLEARTGRQSERLRLARDMHDSVAKSLHGIQIAASMLPRWVRQDPDIAVERAEEIAAAAAHASSEARTLLEGLRETDLSFSEIVARHVKELETGFDGRIEIRGEDDPAWDEQSSAVLLQVDLVLGELLENVRRHSQASSVTLAFTTSPTWSLTVEDDGLGFDPARVPSTRFGLTGVCERVALLEGDLTVFSAPGAGTRVHVRLPAQQLTTT